MCSRSLTFLDTVAYEADGGPLVLLEYRWLEMKMKNTLKKRTRAEKGLCWPQKDGFRCLKLLFDVYLINSNYITGQLS